MLASASAEEIENKEEPLGLTALCPVVEENEKGSVGLTTVIPAVEDGLSGQDGAKTRILT